MKVPAIVDVDVAAQRVAATVSDDHSTPSAGEQDIIRVCEHLSSGQLAGAAPVLGTRPTAPSSTGMQALSVQPPVSTVAPTTALSSADSMSGGPTTSLLGAVVNFSVRYPTLSGLISLPQMAVVRSAVEFPAIQRFAAKGYFLVAADIDLGSSTIDIHFSQAMTPPNTEFNGYLFTFAPNTVVLRGASLNRATSSEVRCARVQYDESSISVNMAGCATLTESRVLVDLYF